MSATTASAAPSTPTAAPQSLLDVVSSTQTHLRALYTHIGISAPNQEVLLEDLDGELRALCNKVLSDARGHVARLEEDIKRAAALVAQSARQLQDEAMVTKLAEAAATSSPAAPSLQTVLSLYDQANHRLVEQKHMHCTVLAGDLARVQGLYTLLAVPTEEIADKTMLESPITVDSADLSTARTVRVQAEVARLQSIQSARCEQITSLLCELSGAWTRLGLGVEDVQHAQIDELLMDQDAAAHRKSPLAPTEATIAALQARGSELETLEASRRAEIESKTAQIVALHKRLSTEPEAIAALQAQCAAHESGPAPLSRAVIAFYDTTIAALEKQKAARMQGLVFDLRERIEAVYADLHMSASERAAFRPFQSTVYNDAVLELHEAELVRATERRAQLAPVFASVSKWRAMKEEVAAFEVSSADPTRLTKRGSHLILLQEEKLRKKRDVLLPALERRLHEQVVAYEAAHPADGDVTLQGVSLRDQLEGSMNGRDETKSVRRAEQAEHRKAKTAAASSAANDAAMGIVRPASATAAATPAKPTASARSSTVAATPVRAASTAAAMSTPAATPRVRAAPVSAAVAPIMETPAKQPTPPIAAATPIASLPAVAPVAPVASLPAPVAATPLKNSRIPASSAQGTPMTPVVRSRIPCFGTSSSALQTVVSTPVASAVDENDATPTPVTTEKKKSVVRAVFGESRTATTSNNARIAPILEDECGAMNKPAAAAPIAPTAALVQDVPAEVQQEHVEVVLSPMPVSMSPIPIEEEDESQVVEYDSEQFDSCGGKVDPSAVLLSDSLSLDPSATLLNDVAARLDACECDADRVAVYTQAIEGSGPTLTQLASLHYERSKLLEKLGEVEQADRDMEMSMRYTEEHQACRSVNNSYAILC